MLQGVSISAGMPMDTTSRRARFAALHESGTFLMPNAWDVGSGRLLESLGFEAIATTSSGLAASLGRQDQTVTLDELVTHVAALCAAVDVPLSVDAEDGYADDIGGLADTVGLLADAGASGISIEDFRKSVGLLDVEEAAERVAAVVEAANTTGLTVTARAENHLYGVDVLDDTVGRLQMYAAAGAHCVYAPGLISVKHIGAVVRSVPRSLNVLLLPVGPTVGELAELGVRRVSTGGALAFAAYGAAARAALELAGPGTQDFTAGVLSAADRERAFGA